MTTSLRRALNFGIRVDPDGQIAVQGPEDETVCGVAHRLAVLEVWRFTAARIYEAQDTRI